MRVETEHVRDAEARRQNVVDGNLAAGGAGGRPQTARDARGVVRRLQAHERVVRRVGTDHVEGVNRERQRLLLNELNHRVKNTLATVQAIVSQTLRSTPDPEAALERVQSRLMALSNTHNLLNATSWSGATLADVVKTTCFLIDLDQFGVFNERYAAAFDEPRPARSAFQVSRLPFDANVEIEAWAHRGPR